jgi:hypothetical protein
LKSAILAIGEYQVYKSKLFCFVFVFFLTNLSFSQESLKSGVEEYYDFLAIQGLVDRPALNYRTLSDSVWSIEDGTGHPWQSQNLGTTRRFLDDKLKLRIYGPELFMSVNTAAPYGQNDGALWQGRGFNTSFSTGLRLDAYGIEATFKPQLAFSQNAAFEIMQSNYDSEYGYFWGYTHNIGIDAPQRFGDKPFFTWDWGDSEIRYAWKTVTMGFGTQAIWLGPAYLNPILHSNNAPSYPKFDIGIRRQPITLPWLNWYAGDIEVRIWIGHQSESDYFDRDPSNDYIMFHGLSFSYAPSFLPGLSLAANRVCLVPWKWENLKYVIPVKKNEFEDQKLSLAFSWLLPKSSFELYGELMIDDYMGGILAYMRHPFEATSYTIGLKKAVRLSSEKKIYGETVFELNWMEMTQNFQFAWPYSPYFHHQLTHGYTNRGQFLGNSSSPGGNSQYLGFILYYPRGDSSISIVRNNPDNNYIYRHAVYASNENGSLHARWASVNKANFTVNIRTNFFITEQFTILGGFAYNLIINPHYKRTTDYYADGNDIYWHNISLQAGFKFHF